MEHPWRIHRCPWIIYEYPRIIHGYLWVPIYLFVTSIGQYGFDRFGFSFSLPWGNFSVNLGYSLTLRVVPVDPAYVCHARNIRFLLTHVSIDSCEPRRSRLRGSAHFGRSGGAALRAAFGRDSVNPIPLRKGLGYTSTEGRRMKYSSRRQF